ncbi:MAG: ABC transporter ATP-binding protein [Bacteroidota bacterium]|jgi:ABC-type multidrug transport system ATPase subunit
MGDVIRVSGLSKSFGNFQALNDLSFSVQKGDVYGFLGQNGAGKSTTIRTLLSLIHPDHGEISLFGYSLFTHRKQILRNIGAIIEKPDLYPFLTGMENLRLFAVMSGVKKSRKDLMDQLKVVGLAERSASKVQTYSQGMKQRLGLAIALVHDPALIILDEPTNGLDPQGIADMRNLIRWMQNDLKKTIFVSSHLLSEVEQIANRMLIIDKGKKIVEGYVKELFNPEDNFVSFITPDIEIAIEHIRSSPFHSSTISTSAQGFQLKMKNENVALLNEWLVGKGIRINGIQSMHSLEKYFIQVTANNQHVESYKA